MNSPIEWPVLAATLLIGACGGSDESPTAPPEAQTLAVSAAPMAAAAIQVDGAFTQTGITSLEVHNAGPVTVLEQTSYGEVTGTLSGTYEDELLVIIRPNGTFTTHFTIRCECEMDGNAGVVDFVVNDGGQITGPTTASFTGKAAVLNATGDLEGLHGVLDIAGTVDLASGLSEYDYTGVLR